MNLSINKTKSVCILGMGWFSKLGASTLSGTFIVACFNCLIMVADDVNLEPILVGYEFLLILQCSGYCCRKARIFSDFFLKIDYP